MMHSKLKNRKTDGQSNALFVKILAINKLRITHSKLEETKDPIQLILSKIANRSYYEYIVEDMESVRHNIDKFRELVVNEDSVSAYL
jgi:hypothetical protein